MVSVTPNLRLTLPDYSSSGWDTYVNNNWNTIDSLLNRAAGVVLYAGVYAANTTYLTNQTVTDPADNSLWQTNLGYTTTAGNSFSIERLAIPGRWTNVTTSIASAAASAATAAGSATAAQTAQTAAGVAQTAAAASALAAANSALTLAASGGATKNAIINGAMEIYQRASSFTVLPTVPQWTLDRWKCSHNGTGGTTTITPASNTSSLLLDLGLAAALNYNVSTIATTTTFRQLQSQIENARTFAGRQVTLSFYAWVASGTMSLGALLTQNFGTGGSPSSSVNTASGAWTITTTPTLYTLTTTLASVFGKTFGTAGNDCVVLTFNLPLASTFSFNISAVQLELGSGATAFAYRPQAQELALCQRYAQLGIGVTASGYAVGAASTIYTPNPFGITMRAAPTMSLTPSAGANYTGVTAYNPTAYGFACAAVSTAAGAVAWTYTFLATAEMQ